MAVVVPFIGAAIGSAVGGTFLGVAAASWGWLAGSLLSSVLFKPPAQQGPRLQDLTITGTDYGQTIPWVAGSPRLAPTYVWVSPLREIANTQKVGKGGGQKVTQYTYVCDVMLRITENITEGVARDWINSELVRNGLTLKDGLWSSITVYTGEIDQLPDPTYEAAVGVGNAPAYRGGTTIVITGLQLGSGKQLPNFEHQVNTASGLNLDGVIINAPLTATTEGTDLAPSPQNATVSDVTIAFDDSGAVMGPEDDEISWSGGKSAVEGYSGQPEMFMAFDYAVEATSGATLPGGLQTFFVLPTGESGFVRWMFRYQADGALDLVCQNFYSAAGPGGSITNVPLTGRFGLRWPPGVSNQIEVYLNGVLVTTATTGGGNMRNPAGIKLGVGSAVPSGKHVSRIRYANFYFGEGTDPIYLPLQNENLQTTLQNLMARARYASSEYEVSSALASVPLEGYATSSVTATRAHLETLRPYGLYECNCSDKIYIFPRATTSAGSIPWEDLGASESPGEPSDPFPLQVGNEIEVPAQIAVRYRNVTANWNIGTEFSDRLISSREQSPQVVEMGFGMTPAQAKKVADTMLKDAMAGLGRATLRVGGRKHARYEPGDILTTTAPNGTAYRFRIITKRDFIFMLEWEVALDDASALDSPAITYEGYISTDTPIRVAPTLWEVLPIRPLRDADASVPGPYVAITPPKLSETDEWPGGVFVRARLPEAFEQQFISGDQCVMGETLSTMDDFAGGSGQVQRTGKLRVRVLGELSSATYYDFFTDRTINAAVVGNEPIRFMTAEFIQNDGVFRIYDVYNFLRGQLGMEDQIAAHGVGARFVLLNNSIRRMVNETTDIDAEQQVKAVTLNLLLDSVEDENFTDDGIALRPLSPVRLLAVADSGDLDFTWIRRSRLVARWTTSGVIAPLGEATEAYRVKVYDNPASDPVRTVDVTAQAWTYTAADQASDGFTSGDPITVTVQQLSDLVGEGDAVTLETEAP